MNSDREELLVLGVDVGTTHLKVGVYDRLLNEKHLFSAPTPVGASGHSGEMDPRGLWQAIKRQLAEVAQRVGGDRITAIGIAGMAESGCLIDASNEPITPILLWHDRRGTRQAAAWRRTEGARFARITGLRTTNVRSIAKWRWLVDAGAPRDARWCGGPEWIVLCLTGLWLTDSTLAVRTGAFDVLRDDYSRELLDLVDAPIGLFPPVRGCPASAGSLLPEIARDVGLPASVQVVLAGHDHIVAAYGAGGGFGDLIDSAGTAEALIRILDTAPDPAQTVKSRMAMTRYFLPGSWALIAGAGATGGLMKQVAGMLGSEPGPLDEQASPPRAYPYDTLKVRLSERGLPVVTIQPGASHSEVWSAVLDLVCERMRRTALRVERLAGQPTRAILIGGAAGSRELARRKSETLGLPAVSLPAMDSSTRGAAALAAVPSAKCEGNPRIKRPG
jgi:xylulokinase